MNTQSIVQLVQRSFFFPIWSDAYCVVVVAVISLNYVTVVIVDTPEFFSVQISEWNPWLHEICGSRSVEALPAGRDAVSAR